MLAAADGYSYLHLVIVAGIITFAVGVKVLTRDSVSAPLPDAARLALCGGVAMYLVGHAALRAADGRRGRVREARRGGGAARPVRGRRRPRRVGLAVAVAALMGALCVAETESVRRVLREHGREASAVR